MALHFRIQPSYQLLYLVDFWLPQQSEQDLRSYVLAPGPVWTGAKNLVPTGIQSPDRPACSQSLYRLSYRARLWKGTYEITIFFCNLQMFLIFLVRLLLLSDSQL